MTAPVEVSPVELIFGDWFPDQPSFKNPGTLLAKNCIPRATSYRDFRSTSPFTDALDGPALGSFWARQSNNTIFNFAGDATKLYALSGTSWDDVSQASVTYSASFWDWVQVNDRIIATDGGATDLQYYDMGTSSDFADLPGSPPRFKAIGQVSDFIVGGNWSFGGDVEPGGFAWSGFNNSEIWTPALATQSNRVPARGFGGQVQRIIPGKRGIGIRENSIVLINYEGPPNVFNLDETIVNHGTGSPRSVCFTREYVFYHSNEGFMQMDRNTLAITPIGAGKINNWFTGEAAASAVVDMCSAVDRARGLVFWAFKSSSASAVNDRILCYNWVFQRWAYAVVSTQFISEYASATITLDELDALLGGDIDSESIPVDTEAYLGGTPAFLAFDSSNRGATFNGSALMAEIETKEIALPRRHTFVDGVRPLVEGSPTAIEVAPITRNRLNDSGVLGTYVTQDDEGNCDFVADARYQKYRTRISGGFEHAIGVEVPVAGGGEL